MADDDLNAAMGPLGEPADPDPEAEQKGAEIGQRLTEGLNPAARDDQGVDAPDGGSDQSRTTQSSGYPETT